MNQPAANSSDKNPSDRSVERRDDGKTDLDRALDDSFPASDPPAATSGTTATPTEPHTLVIHQPEAGLVHVYRVVPKDQADAPFGEQDSYAAGRWSSAGTPAVYASQSVMGAILEYLAHDHDPREQEVMLASATLPDDCVVAQAALPSTWSDYPYHEQAQCIGDHWVQTHKSLALKLPSALAPDSFNYLINPTHVDKVHMQSIQVRPLRLDPRLLGRSEAA